MQIWNLSDVVEIWKSWQNNQFDGLVVFSGKRGLGKSTGAVKCAAKFPQFKLKRDIAYSRDDVIKKLANKKQGIIVADEMINVTYNRDFFSEQQKRLIKMLNMYRDSCNILIACVPNFYDLDKQFRNLVKMRIEVVRRGLACVHTPNQTSYASDIWDMNLNEKIERKWLEKKIFKPNYSRLTTFKAYFKYGKLTKKLQRHYDEIKARKRNIIYEDENKKSINPKDKFEILINNVVDKLVKGEMRKEELMNISRLTGVKWETITRRIRSELVDRNVKETLRELYLDSGKKTPPLISTHHDRKIRKI